MNTQIVKCVTILVGLGITLSGCRLGESKKESSVTSTSKAKVDSTVMLKGDPTPCVFTLKNVTQMKVDVEVCMEDNLYCEESADAQFFSLEIGDSKDFTVYRTHLCWRRKGADSQYQNWVQIDCHGDGEVREIDIN